MITIPKLNESLIQQANNNSFNGTRGNTSNSNYIAYAKKILTWDISDNKKQELLDKLHKKYSEVLRLEANHISMMYAGPANYNPKWDKSNKIMEKSNEIYVWYKEMEEQAKNILWEDTDEIDYLIGRIKQRTLEPSIYSANEYWRNLAKINREKFNSLYEEINKIIKFKKNTIPYKIYNGIEKIEENKKITILDKDDIKIWQNTKTYIWFKMKPKQQLIFALKKKGFYWNAQNGCWQSKKINIEWLKDFEEMYGEYI